MDQSIDSAAGVLAGASRGVALTGAGISTPSGLPAFRGEDGIWDRYEPGTFSIQYFRRDPGGFWRKYRDLHEEIFGGSTIRPNPAHDAIAELVRDGSLDRVITQNIDGLHQESGTPEDRVIELHGSGRHAVCLQCEEEEPIERVLSRLETGEPPPVCERCASPMKPGAVLFGELLPSEAREQSERLSERSDVFLVAGSSLSVDPAGSLPRTALERGADVIMVNLEPTYLSDRAPFVFHGDVTEVLPELACRVTEHHS